METKINKIVTELNVEQIVEKVELNCDMSTINTLKDWKHLLNEFISYNLPLFQLETNAPDNDFQTQDSYQLGMLDYISYIIGQIINETIIHEHTKLLSIQTYSNYWSGTHTWTFALNDIEELDQDETLLPTLLDCFKEVFPYDSEACLSSEPQISYCNGSFTIIVPFTC